MYSEISSNRHRTWLLIALFIGVLAAVGYVYGQVTGTGYNGLIFALIVSLGMTLVSWFAGDKLVLWSTGAQEITSREQNAYVWNLVENLAITAGLPRPRIYLIEDQSPNAFATGRDPQHASVAMTTGIVQRLENEELEGVIAHELSHVKNYDMRVMLLTAVLVGALSLLGDYFFRVSFFGGRRRSDRRDGGLDGIFMILGLVFIILAPFIGQLIKLAISRRREYLADASGALLTRYPEGLARALEKIRDAAIPLQRNSQATAHLWISEPVPSGGFWSKLQGLFSTHPPINERITRLRAMGK